MDKIYELAEKFATEKHKDQMYGDVPYTEHLKEVSGAVWLWDKTAFRNEHVTIAWLHDVLEDTETELDELSEYFGEHIANSVEALSHYGEPFYKYMAKVKNDPSATYIKMLDRFCNMKNCKENHRLTKRYIKEYPEFKAALYTPQVHGYIWDLLDKEYRRLLELE